MLSHPIVMMILTHPLHVALVGMILSRVVCEMGSATARAPQTSHSE
jgi:hypothetical protein